MKPNRVIIALAALLIAACAPGPVEDPSRHGMDPAKLAQIDQAVEESIAEGNIPGAVLAVVRGQSLVCLKAYGNKSVVPDTIPMTVETMFDIASLSKCVSTTLCAMKLIEEGRLNLTDPVKQYIPEFAPWTNSETGETQEIIVRDLMTHASGIDAYFDAKKFVSRFGENQPDSLLKVIATEAGRNFRPGTGFLYSCLNYITLQNIIQRITGQRLDRYAQEQIFAPLGLKHTCYFPLEADMRTPAEHRELLPVVAPTAVQEDGSPLLGAVHDPLARRANGGVSGNAGLFANAVDLARICIMIMGEGSAPASKKLGFPKAATVLKPETVALMCTIPPENAPEVGRALGWDKKSDHSAFRGDIFNPETTLEHTGYTGTSIVIDIETKTAIVLLTNRVHPTDDGLVTPLRTKISNIVAGSIVDYRN